MQIFLHNSLSRRKEPFVPLQPGQVGLYVCGPTVYGDLHLGNFRCFVVFDTLARFLRQQGFKVTRVQNFTDIDDKMIARAAHLGTSVEELAERYIARYEEDAATLGIEPAQVHPRATRHVPQIIAFIQGLLDKNLAYPLDGDVYFDVTRFPSYGQLSNQSEEERLAGARVEVDPRKHHPADFVLWKSAKPGEPHWPSPWGEGRPGWHIECSVMSEVYLGPEFDIHAGGADLMFPHHENELAQSVGLHSGGFARYWLHNGMLLLGQEKMSRSLGNIIRVTELKKRYPGQVLRLFLLSVHYRRQMAFSEELLEASRTAWERLSGLVQRLQQIKPAEGGLDLPELHGLVNGARQQFLTAMADDLNTASALAALFDLTRTINSHEERGFTQASQTVLLALYRELLGDVLGLQLPSSEPLELEAPLQALLAQRELARQQKDFRRADALRQQLKDLGVLLEDTPQGVRWRRTEASGGERG